MAKPSSFPVGKVNFMQIDPMTFMEFLLANGDENLARYLENVDTIDPIPDAFFNPLYEKLKMYYVTGGMPEPVLMWMEARNVFPNQVKLRVRFSLDNLKLDDDVLNIPLFMADQTEGLIGQALEQRCE